MPFAVYRSGRTSSIKVEHVQLKEEIVWVRLYDIKAVSYTHLDVYKRQDKLLVVVLVETAPFGNKGIVSSVQLSTQSVILFLFFPFFD